MRTASILRSVVKELEAGFDAKPYLDSYDRIESEADWAIDCPKCGPEGKRKKLYVVVKKKMVEGKEKHPGTWVCFSCEEHGGALDLVQRLDGVGFMAAVDLLRKWSVGAERVVDIKKYVDKLFANDEQHEPVVLNEVSLPKEFQPITKDGPFPIYAAQRGVDRRKALRYGVGFCAVGEYRNRLIVPVTRNGVVVAFQGRWMRKDPPQGVKKYLNDRGAGKTTAALFGADLAKQLRVKRCILLEDTFSAMFIGPGGIPLRGTHFSMEHMNILGEIGCDEIVVCLDKDAADKADKIAKKLSALFITRVVQLPDARDPDEYRGIERQFWRLVDSAPYYGSGSSLKDYVDSRI